MQNENITEEHLEKLEKERQELREKRLTFLVDDSSGGAFSEENSEIRQSIDKIEKEILKVRHALKKSEKV